MEFCIFELVWGTVFQLKLIILIVWAKFTQKMYFQLKTEQAVPGLQAFAFWVVNVSSTVVLKHFEDSKDIIILNILKEKLVMSCLLGSFFLKLHNIKFLYNFTGQLKNLNFVMVMDKSFWQVLSTFTFWLIVCFFHDWDSSILNIKTWSPGYSLPHS